PDSVSYDDLLFGEDPAADLSRPYPFYLAHQLEDPARELGSPREWCVEWKWDGIRAQLIRRGGDLSIWSRGEDLITPRFPELRATLDHLPDGCVLDGELLAWDFDRDQPMGFSDLQKRLGRKTVPKKLLSQGPCILRAYDLLEAEGEDWRPRPLRARRAKLEEILAATPPEANLRLSPQVAFADWAELEDLRARARDFGAEGFMLKRWDSPYQAGRKKGDWWKWKTAPLVVDAVMIYAQAGHGRRANLYTDFTFAAWDGEALVPFTKAYSGLTDAEFSEISAWVRKNTLERFGPVRRVPPELVFEIAFEGIQASTRHKSGLALRFPRMSRWRKDKPAAEANSLDDLKEMLALYG
ncbi:MAG: cisplatin damage response ATP-dependent DNA ligase, partial [Mangrovicoccus sp.]